MPDRSITQRAASLPLKACTESNRRAWNEVMPYHQQAAREKWAQRCCIACQFVRSNVYDIPAQYDSTEAQYWFVHTLSGVISALIASGLAIEHFCEFDTAISPHQQPVEALHAGVPLSYTLIAR